jgi:hypothetical protein
MDIHAESSIYIDFPTAYKLKQHKDVKCEFIETSIEFQSCDFTTDSRVTIYMKDVIKASTSISVKLSNVINPTIATGKTE